MFAITDMVIPPTLLYLIPQYNTVSIQAKHAPVPNQRFTPFVPIQLSAMLDTPGYHATPKILDGSAL